MDLKKTDRTNFTIKIVVIILSFISPLIMFFTYGEMSSISSYWESPLQPLFILSNALTTYVFMDLPKWKLSGILLFMLTIFSVEYYPSLHNVFAISFFVVNIYPIYKLKRYRLFLIPYLLSCVFLFNLFWFEVFAIGVLCSYHLTLLLKVRKVIKGNHT
jgi:hypothetical protein|tara:strand:- start:4332 stop:4808 length:477 start_codon:yes stop_codon:yes gene_type:complete